MTQFHEMLLDKNLLKTLEELGYEKPTPIQEMAIPKVMDGLDLVASAQTGTGKTGAFLLPAIHMLSKLPQDRPRGARVLVLAPTRELAMQIAKEADKFSKSFPQIKTVCIYGGVPYPQQRKALSKPYDILVATPGRLIDHMERGLIHLSKLKMLVLDEADRMLDMGFIQPIERIAAATPQTRQTLLFSATLDPKILRVSKKLQNNPYEIRIKVDSEAEANIEQRIFYTDNKNHKIKILEHLLESGGIEQAILFIATKRDADELARQLQEKGLMADALHGDMNQRQRTRTMDALRKGRIRYLIATDVAARGLDILTLTHVINIDLPFRAEDYIHRIGRIGRAGAKGCAITFVSHRDRGVLSQIQKQFSKPITSHSIPGLEPKERSSNQRKKKRNFGFHKNRARR